MKSFNYPVTIKILYEKEAKEAPYVAYIPEFDVSSCGISEEEAIKNVNQALEITLEEVKEKVIWRSFCMKREYQQKNHFFISKLLFNLFRFIYKVKINPVDYKRLCRVFEKLGWVL